VILTENAYPYMNGMMGTIQSTTPSWQTVRPESIDFFDKPEESLNGDDDGDKELLSLSLELGYCISCHKAQGSECVVVVLVWLGRSGSIMHRRRLLYTALTRAKKRCIILSCGPEFLEETSKPTVSASGIDLESRTTWMSLQ